MKWVLNERFSSPITLKEALTHFLDLTTPISQTMLGYLAEIAADKQDSFKLEQLSKDTNEYEKWKFERYPNLSEVVEEFPSLKLTSSLLLTQLPKLQPRFYSISSSPKANYDEIHLTVGLVEYLPKSKTQSVHYGVCSKWLDEINNGDIVHAFIRR